MHAAMQYGPGRAQIKMAALASAPRNALIELFSVWSELRIGARAASENCARMSDVGIGPEIQVHVDKQFPVGTLKCHRHWAWTTPSAKAKSATHVSGTGCHLCLGPLKLIFRLMPDRPGLHQGLHRQRCLTA